VYVENHKIDVLQYADLEPGEEAEPEHGIVAVADVAK
jgi:hypothetical protein